MEMIIATIKPGEAGPSVSNLQDVMFLLLEKKIFKSFDSSNRPTLEELQKLADGLKQERAQPLFGKATQQLVRYFQIQQGLGDNLDGIVEEKTAAKLNALLKELGVVQPDENSMKVFGIVRDESDSPLANIAVQAFDRDLRSEQTLGQSKTDRLGFYQIHYSAGQFNKAEKGNADIVVKAIAADGSLLIASPVLFNAPPVAEVNITVPAGMVQPRTLFENIAWAIKPLLDGAKVEELEENQEHQDVSFLTGETGINQTTLARFALAHRLVQQGIQAEFWFVLLGGSFYQFAENKSLADQLAVVWDRLPSLDANALQKAFVRGFNQKEISESFREHVDSWIEAFLNLIVDRSVNGGTKPTFVKSALEDANINDPKKQEAFARLFNEHRALTPELLTALEKDAGFKQEEIADLRTSFQLSDLTRSDFSVVGVIKKGFGVRQPEQIRTLAKKSEAEWVKLVQDGHAAGNITLPFDTKAIAGDENLPNAEIYGKTLERNFREAFPTTAFAGGLERALKNGGAHGFQQPEVLGQFLNFHPNFEILKTPIDLFLNNGISPAFKAQAKDESFRLELKAVQRVFKLSPNFEATDALLADDLHSAQKIYRLGQSEFVRRYEKRPGFTTESAQLAWNRAADTHAAVLTVVADLKALEAEALPLALQNNNQALANFPNWNNLFLSGDLCDCESCRSVLSPAAYFADLLMFLKDRKAKNPLNTTKDLLFKRRPDLGYLELNCDNALVALPYVDVVCEVLEDVVAAGENDLELTGFVAMPVGTAPAKAAVIAAFAAKNIRLGDDFTLTQVAPADPDQWVAHGDEVTYLLKKKASANFFAEILRNTKVSTEELRAYPQYVNPKAYEKLRSAIYPLSLPFDLFAAEVRAGFQKSNLQRWDLMRTLRGTIAPNNPSDGDIASEYFGISVDATATFDEKRLILQASAGVASQQALWGELGNAAWLDTVGNVKNFLQKTGLEYSELLALLDLKFINPTGDIAIQHLDPSCDTDKKVIQVLDEIKLDRIHRFLRLWRKLSDWKMWELDLVIRHPRVGNGSLDEPFLINLFYFSQARNRLGGKTSVEQMCGLFGNLNTETRFTKLHEKRQDALYQYLFLNKRLIRPLDPSFEVAKVNVPAPTVEKISTHQPVVLAALGIREADLLLLMGLTKPSDGTPYISDDLTLTNLSFVWRHAWLPKQLKLKPDDWKTVLKLFNQDVPEFANPKAAHEFIEKVDQLKASGFVPDELSWLLIADRSAKAAVKEADTARFLSALRKELQSIHTENDPAQYAFLSATPPTDTDSLSALLTSLLQKLNRDDAATLFFIATLRDEVGQEKKVAGIPGGFIDFPAPIKSAIRIAYDKPTSTLRFTGLMTAAQRTTLLTDASLAAVTGVAGYQDAIDEFFNRPRLALKFFEEVFTAPLQNLPTAIDFKALPDPALALKISYDAEQRLLRVAGILSKDEKVDLDALSADVSYRNAVNSLFTQPTLGIFLPGKIWLLEADLLFPLRDLVAPVNDNLAKNLAAAATKALSYLSITLAENAVVEQSSSQLGLTPAITRLMFSRYALLPATLLTHLTGAFAGTIGVVDYSTLKATFDGWFWASRVARIWKKWTITLKELESLLALTVSSNLLDMLSLPLDMTGAIPSLDQFIRTARLLRLRDSLPETEVTLLDVLGSLNSGAYASAADFAVDVERINEDWRAVDVKTLTASLNLNYPADYLFAESWERLRRAFYFLDNLNAGTTTVNTFAAATMLSPQAKALKELLRSKFGTETWLTLSADIQNVLRERKRDALAAYIITQPKPADAPSGKWENINDLYAYYLLDVEMSSCQLTSRLVQGSGSVQLFVQRCFMGLERNVVAKADGDDGDSAWRWWKWMRKYRVWEANRKVFLWPENWIEPELKKDRSPFFKDLENELLQNDVNQYTVETAFSNYLEKLDGVAQLEIAGFYQEDDGDNAIIHVFGRTTGVEPHLYYYRRYDYRQWTPWEKVDLDIQGDYLIPAVVNKRLFLFWPLFTEIPDEKENTQNVPIPSPGATNAPLKKTVKKLRLQMAVSDFRQGKWTPKRVSKDFDESDSYSSEIVRKHYCFFPIDRAEIDGRFAIKYSGYSADAAGNPLGSLGESKLNRAFEISGCKGIPNLIIYPGNANFQHTIRPEADSTGAVTTFLKWVELGPVPKRNDSPQNDFTLENNFSNPIYLRLAPILTETPGIFKMSPSWQLSYLDKLWLDGLLVIGGYFEGRLPISVGSWLSYFYNDKKRTFFVLPTLWQPLGEKMSTNTAGVRLYYPEIKKAFRQWEDHFAGQIQSWLNSIDLSTWPALFRQQVEQFMHQQFSEEAPPPYTDGQLKNLIERYWMRFFHYFLGLWSQGLFQFRQFHFKNFYHPFVCDLAKLVNNPLKGIPALMSRNTQLVNSGFNFRQSYQPTPWVVELPPVYPKDIDCYPKEIFDFSPDGSYSPYNWELFFHVPLLIANSLSKNQRFEEARDWYHFIFNPIGVESAIPGGSVMSKYWITKPFFETTDPQYVQQRIDNILLMLAGDTSVPGFSAQAKKDLEDQVLDWRTNPFEPHRIANYRTVAYQKTVVMKYLDNLIAWGDNLFRQDSMESISEATQMYIMAAEILGPRPMKIPPQAKPTLESFNELETQFDKFSNALVEVENLVPQLSGNGQGGSDQAPLPMLYFCIPQNDKLLGYWDTVADRLYKIRHCMNIEGVVRQLALFEPPIDPGALVKAVAAGVDISAALADLSAPLPLYRFNVLLQKANEVCNDVKALGGAMLAALEKKDAEALGQLRQSQEIRLLEAVKAVREKQIEEAKDNLEGVKKNKELITIRRDYYKNIENINSSEKLHQDKLEQALIAQQTSQVINIAASLAHLVPEVSAGVSGFGGSPSAKFAFGGSQLGSSLQAVAGGFNVWANVENYNANKAATNAGHERRWDDWKFQERLANKELEQIEKSIASAELRVTIAESELKNHAIQIENARSADEFMRSKYTNLELFQWQIGQISGTYFQSYKLAYDLAKRAERCFRFELGLQDSSFINFGYWDSLKKGLLSGEKLQYDLRRLETAYLEQNHREFELTKHVSIALLDPLALIKLRETGRCFFRLPEEIFDLDYPGHYFRRIKSVSMTLPCVAGPYTTISCTLRLLKNSIRINTANGDNGYPHNADDQGIPTDDVRYVENNIPAKAIAASNAQNDSGVFELSFRDERYLPFEGAGAVSEWSLELFNDIGADFGKPLRQIDYGTISDAILHVKYTAREDTGPFKNGAVTHLRDYFSQDGTTPSMRMFNLRQEFPSEWHRFLNPTVPADGNVFELEMASLLFPLRDAEKTLKVNTIWLLARCLSSGSYQVVMTPPLPAPPPPGSNSISVVPVNQFGGLHFGQKDVAAQGIEITLTDPTVKWRLTMTRPGGGNLQQDPTKKIMEVEDMILVLGYEWD
jgi:Tc toxin complex TcA C-terminal TcB-binding domain/Neuraminidase-like domain/Salmonella virulence plasmid 28.1kDa A protein